jgi:hypothetical protein
MRLRFLPTNRGATTFNLKTLGFVICAIAPALTGNSIMVSPASAAVAGAGSLLQHQLKEASPLVEVYVRRGGVARRTTVVGPHGRAASRTVVRRGAVVAPGARTGRWVRPANYYWRPGGAIAAGAAIGVVTAATAAAWAGAPPAPGSCWYYTDPSRTQGFWDVCQ